MKFPTVELKFPTVLVKLSTTDMKFFTTEFRLPHDNVKSPTVVIARHYGWCPRRCCVVVVGSSDVDGGRGGVMER
jgi:hypothetical protein